MDTFYTETLIFWCGNYCPVFHVNDLYYWCHDRSYMTARSRWLGKNVKKDVKVFVRATVADSAVQLISHCRAKSQPKTWLVKGFRPITLVLLVFCCEGIGIHWLRPDLVALQRRHQLIIVRRLDRQKRLHFFRHWCTRVRHFGFHTSAHTGETWLASWKGSRIRSSFANSNSDSVYQVVYVHLGLIYVKATVAI